MIRIEKKFFVGLAVLLAASSFSAQEKPEEDIMLPEVSTVISGGAPKAGKSAVPDFSRVLPNYSENKEVLPKFPNENDKIDTETSVISDSSGSPAKNVYAEGLAGAGYPGFFTGNFSIYRQSGSSPFAINFSHDRVHGYAGKSLTSGYFDKNTFISATKKFATEKHIVELGAKYESVDNGLQDRFENISELTLDLIGANFDWNWNVGHGWSLAIDAKGNLYRRFSTITGNPLVPIEDFVESISVLDVSPKLTFGWAAGGLHVFMGADWICEHDIFNSFLEKATINRGNFFVDMGWKNEFVNLYGIASAVVGNQIGDNDVIVPFTVGSDFTFVSKLSSRKIHIGLSGGIESVLPKVFELERQFRFSALQVLPGETSFWFGKFSLSLPVKDVFTFGFDGKYMTTAYGNGSWHPDYEDDSSILCGQYLYGNEDVTAVNTNAFLSFKTGPATFSAQWLSYWADVPAAEYAQYVSASISVQDKGAKVVFDGKIGVATDSDDDNCPVVDLSISFKVTESVRLAVTANDAVKLACGNTRTYAGQYIQRSGWAGLVAKFFF